MKILYNPPKGQPIGEGYNDFIYQGEKIEAHLPGEVKQYESGKAEKLLEIFGFLAEISPEEAKKIIETPKKGQYQCKYCDFSTDLKIALQGHMKKHKEEIQKESAPLVDPNIIPVASGTKIVSNRSINSERSVNEKAQVPEDGIDRDGVGWYGGGAKEEHGFERVKPDNQGHFGRQKLE